MISMIVTSLENDQGRGALGYQAEVLQIQDHPLNPAFPKRQLISLVSHAFSRLSIKMNLRVIDFCVILQKSSKVLPRGTAGPGGEGPHCNDHTSARGQNAAVNRISPSLKEAVVETHSSSERSLSSCARKPFLSTSRKSKK